MQIRCQGLKTKIKEYQEVRSLIDLQSSQNDKNLLCFDYLSHYAHNRDVL